MINHEEMLATLAKAFAQIATVLPRVRIKLLLYPTEQIKLAVSTLYAQIIKFMQRAMNWYLEGKTKHLISSIFRPVELRFKDLLEEIESCSQSVDQLAVSAGQAEQRDMHILLLEIKRNVLGTLLTPLVHCPLIKECREPSRELTPISRFATEDM